MRVALAALLLVSASCSIALQDRPTTAARCSPSKAWIADAVIAAAHATAIGYGLYRNDETGTLIVGPNAVAGIVWLASAGNGRAWSRECGAHPSGVALQATRVATRPRQSGTIRCCPRRPGRGSGGRRRNLGSSRA